MQTETLNNTFISQNILDPSCRAPLWFLSPESNLVEWEEILSTLIDLTHFGISETGFEDSSMKSAESFWEEVISFKPRTPLGKKLWGIRKRIIASGDPLLSWEEIDQEIAAQRGDME